MRLALLRHAKSSWSHAGLEDFSRPLSGRGERDAPAMGRLLHARGLTPERIVCSDAARARATAEAVAQALGYPADNIIRLHALYLAAPAAYLSALEKHAADTHHVLMVGHNPGISDLVHQLADIPIDHMPTCAYALIEFSTNSWSSIKIARGRLVEYFYPRRDLAG